LHGSNNDTTKGNQIGTKNKTLFARYLFSRCDIVLWPDELEPTPELAGLIEAIHRTKNIKILQRLHAEYGNYFSQRVTLGGSLLSSKGLTANDSQDFNQQKESFRTSVGTSVSGNVGIYNAGVSASHEVTSGNANTNENSSQTQNEVCVFEAVGGAKGGVVVLHKPYLIVVGGDTILSINPKAWCPTVADYKLWRVVNFVMTEWTIIAPFDKELKNGTRVILRSCFQESDTNEDPTSIHMVVFRSVQGAFVPAMSDSSDCQYWRILKTDAGERHIKPGGNIRLCWDFRDQTTGWRDFNQDVLGRREVRRPSGVLNPLFIKVPWLRYNAYEIDGPLPMSAEREDHAERHIKVHINGTDGVLPCRLRRLQLRIDSIGNVSHGDAEDYLLKTVEAANSGKRQKDKSPSPQAPAQQEFHMWLYQAASLSGL
ncbi:unnamed protein product, partial [Fusarium equiseti]